MQLFDMRGNLVATLFDQQVRASDKYQVVYKTEKLTNGIYLVRVAGKDQVRHQKIIIEKQ
jgi:hypothetical protein